MELGINLCPFELWKNLEIFEKKLFNNYCNNLRISI